MTQTVEVIQQMREVLHPHGTAPIVRLFLRSSAYFDQAFVTDCINELEKVATAAHVFGETLTPLQQLALHVLKDSAFIDMPKKNEENLHAG